MRWPFLLIAACSFSQGTAVGVTSDGKLVDTPAMTPDGTDAAIDAPSWAYKRILTIDNTGLAALSDYPLLVVLDGTRIRYSTSGADLRFTTPGGIGLSYEIEKWDPTGQSFVWVRVPSIPMNAATTIVMLYDNPAATDAQNATNVWDSNFIGVWHLADEHDSTGRNMSTNHGATPVAGKIGTAMTFASSHYIDTASADHPTLWTMEAWIDPTSASSSSTTNGTAIIARFPNYMLLWDCNAPGFCQTALYDGPNSGTAGTYRAGYTATAGQWTYVAATYEGAHLTAYSGGAQTGQQGTNDTPLDATPSTTTATIGILQNLAGGYTGAIDEVRISKVARSIDYVKANAKAVAGTYVSFGAEQPN